MQHNIIIFHGTGGHPKENWFPWLKEKLESKGHRVLIPQFPTPDPKTPKEWFAVLKEYKEYIDQDTIIIGHSLGGGFLLRVLEALKTPIHAAVFVAASAGIKPIKFYEGDRPFVEAPFNWENIRTAARHFIVFHSDTDPFVSLGNGELIAREVGTPLTCVKGAGHFNESAGYTKFPLLLKKLEPLLF